MSEKQDQRIVNLLRAGAPPARDPLFRLKVLERREQQRFQRRLFTMLAGTLVIILVSMLAIGTGGGALKTTGTLVVGTALATAYLAFRNRLLWILRRFSI
jgi:hypothetical protein